MIECCENCGVKFYTKYYHGGSIEHTNYTSYGNIVTRSHWFDKEPERRYDQIFLHSIALGGNYCNVKNNSYKVAIQIQRCVKKMYANIWRADIVEYIDSFGPVSEEVFYKFKKLKGIRQGDIKIKNHEHKG